ncbi:hypothetical protein AA102526_1769 [Asaia lannensis NBRC 102526]|nr:hypothetical protein AA102526_1769 [Asaia lannensis NBRC 102526]
MIIDHEICAGTFLTFTRWQKRKKSATASPNAIKGTEWHRNGRLVTKADNFGIDFTSIQGCEGDPITYASKARHTG